VQKLHTAFAGALATPEVKARFAQLMAEPVGGTPEQFAALMQREYQRYEAVVKASGAKAE
jgi:tripartite-type tricarboxylate transporter receptor subunit TctC